MIFREKKIIKRYIDKRLVAKPGHFLNPFVFILKMVWQTHVAPVTVEVVLPAAHPAYPAASTMELLLVLVIVEFAFVAEILAKLKTTLPAGISEFLSVIAPRTFHLGDIVPVIMLHA